MHLYVSNKNKEVLFFKKLFFAKNSVMNFFTFEYKQYF